MLSISNLLLLNAVRYWVSICKDKYELATQCVANYGTMEISAQKKCLATFWQQKISKPL